MVNEKHFLQFGLMSCFVIAVLAIVGIATLVTPQIYAERLQGAATHGIAQVACGGTIAGYSVAMITPGQIALEGEDVVLLREGDLIPGTDLVIERFSGTCPSGSIIVRQR